MQPKELLTDEAAADALRNLENVLAERFPYHPNIEITDVTCESGISEVIRIFYTFENAKRSGATSIWCKFRIETSGAITDFEEC